MEDIYGEEQESTSGDRQPLASNRETPKGDLACLLSTLIPVGLVFVVGLIILAVMTTPWPRYAPPEPVFEVGSNPGQNSSPTQQSWKLKRVPFKNTTGASLYPIHSISKLASALATILWLDYAPSAHKTSARHKRRAGEREERAKEQQSGGKTKRKFNKMSQMIAPTNGSIVITPPSSLVQCYLEALLVPQQHVPSFPSTQPLIKYKLSRPKNIGWTLGSLLRKSDNGDWKVVLPEDNSEAFALVMDMATRGTD
ncbi:hypothetical protein FALBO_13228 [Fusarium albosuccineum]|uniref:Uncharacterized protein n=1 Tax=Fusarium albosuccineum TaxID=1237068 RepID=A0A8H4L1M8_9HYPO|nr:hypothetical protein FALBO_13228 [Fusarium albosuccineum]